jgi:NTE family protein
MEHHMKQTAGFSPPETGHSGEAFLNKQLRRIVSSVKAFGLDLKRQRRARQPADQASRRPLIGLALGGGFARGLAHIGVLRVLEQENIPIDFIAGTSIGSVVGAGYASGMTAGELEEVASQVRFKDFSRWTVSRFGLFSNDKMAAFLRNFIRCRTFEELRIPLSVTATDIITGEAAIFSSGDLIDPVRASCAYPGMFLPVRINDQWLVDGFLAHSVPATPLRQMGAERVISIHLRSQWVKPKGPRHALDVIGQCFSIAQEKTSHTWRSASDLILEPEIGEFAYDDFVHSAALFKAGETVARAALPQIREWVAGERSAVSAQHSAISK